MKDSKNVFGYTELKATEGNLILQFAGNEAFLSRMIKTRAISDGAKFWLP
jgi:hypothetical protein